MLSPDTDVEIFTFDNGASIATFYVPAEQVLSPAQHVHAVWLEFEVDDVDRVRNELVKLGIEPFD